MDSSAILNNWSNRQSNYTSDSECNLCLLWSSAIIPIVYGNPHDCIHIKYLKLCCTDWASKQRLKWVEIASSSWTDLFLVKKPMTVGVRTEARQWMLSMFRVAHEGTWRVRSNHKSQPIPGAEYIVSFDFSNKPLLLYRTTVHFHSILTGFIPSRYLCSKNCDSSWHFQITYCCLGGSCGIIKSDNVICQI